jgi:ABC-type polar amino acid transport system ATPase subunit
MNESQFLIESDNRGQDGAGSVPETTEVDVVELRRLVSMVFQKPNPFPNG